MHRPGLKLEVKNCQRALAVLGCLALLYFAFAAFAPHDHTGPEAACAVCHTLHLPALASTPIAVAAKADNIAWLVVSAGVTSALDSFASHRASRAPPAL